MNESTIDAVNKPVLMSKEYIRLTESDIDMICWHSSREIERYIHSIARAHTNFTEINLEIWRLICDFYSFSFSML